MILIPKLSERRKGRPAQKRPAPQPSQHEGEMHSSPAGCVTHLRRNNQVFSQSPPSRKSNTTRKFSLKADPDSPQKKRPPEGGL
jgi:hypothetical protein